MDHLNFVAQARIYAEQLVQLVSDIEKTIKLYNAEGGAPAFTTVTILGGDPPTPAEFDAGLTALQDVADTFNDPVRLAKIVRIKQ